jgi:O-antigen/teichoic acid export membrane protein
MSTEARATVRGVGLLALQRGFHVVAGVIFALFVPRLMGPDTFGRYALVTSVSLWFALITGMGAVSAMSRFVPQFVASGDHAGLEKLVSNLLVLRLVNGLLAATAYFLLTAFWLRELDPLVLAFVAGSVLLRTGANLFFGLFLGLNKPARWGAGELLRRWLSLFFVAAGFFLAELRGACLGLLLTEAVIFTIGLWWARAYIRRGELRPDRRHLAPFLRFSLFFFAGNLLLTFTHRSGETLVRVVSGDYAQVGFYGVAYGVYHAAAHALWQFTLAFAPVLTTTSLSGPAGAETARRQIELLLKWMTIGGVLAVFGVLLVGDDLLPLVFGPEFRSVAANLVPLTLSLLTAALGNVGRVLSLVRDRPGIALHSAAIQLAAFWGLGVPLVQWGGSFGACAAVLVASAVHAAYLTRRMSAESDYSARIWAVVVLLGAPFLLLLWARSSWVVNVALYGVFAAGYGGILMLLRVVTLSELASLWRILRERREQIDGSSSGSASELQPN